MVKHIVMFKLKGTAEERRAVASQFKAALEALPEKIDVLRSIEVGLNQNPAETWDVVLTAVVDKMADVEVYAKHPAHVAAAGLLGGFVPMGNRHRAGKSLLKGCPAFAFFGGVEIVRFSEKSRTFVSSKNKPDIEPL